MLPATHTHCGTPLAHDRHDHFFTAATLLPQYGNTVDKAHSASTLFNCRNTTATIRQHCCHYPFRHSPSAISYRKRSSRRTTTTHSPKTPQPQSDHNLNPFLNRDGHSSHILSAVDYLAIIDTPEHASTRDLL